MNEIKKNCKELEKLCFAHNLALEICYSRKKNWCVQVSFFGIQKTTIVRVENCEIEYALDKINYDLKNWLIENRGGY